jgi:hypothetical protein
MVLQHAESFDKNRLRAKAKICQERSPRSVLSDIIFSDGLPKVSKSVRRYGKKSAKHYLPLEYHCFIVYEP